MSNVLTDRFRPAGHKAQELSEIVMPVEVFKPIQRVIDTTLERDDKTVGYLFKDVEYVGTHIDVVLSNGYVRDEEETELKSQRLLKTPSEWQIHERNPIGNPNRWAVPSLPLILELRYRSLAGDSALAETTRLLWRDVFAKDRYGFGSPLQTSTLVYYDDCIARVWHDWDDYAGESLARVPALIRLKGEDDPTIKQFLYTLLGKRQGVAGAFQGRLYLFNFAPEAPEQKKQYLQISPMKKWFNIQATEQGDYHRLHIIGVAPLKNFPSPRYEVRDA